MVVCIRDRLFSLIYRSVALSAILFLFIGSLVTTPLFSDTFWTYSLQTAALSGFSLAFGVYRSATNYLSTGRVGVSGSLKGPLSLAILSYSILGTIFFFSGESPLDLYYLPWQIALSVLSPLLVLVDYLLFIEKGSVSYSHPPYFAIYPFFYVIIMWVKPFITGYDVLSSCRFLSPQAYMLLDLPFISGNGGYNGMCIASVLILVIFLAIAYILVFLDHFFGGRFKRQDKEVY